ncbi:MAG: hypothetical protein V4701_05855 [Pseudomonadota bacterium]
MARVRTLFSDPQDHLLDRETMESPRRLSRDEHRAVVGADWVWTQAEHEEEDIND